jgi:imidazolonepropionase-like amidohydrolase
VRGAGQGAKLVDLRGRALLPGFVDAHGHLVLAAHSLLNAKLDDAESIPQLIQARAAHAHARPPTHAAAGTCVCVCVRARTVPRATHTVCGAPRSARGSSASDAPQTRSRPSRVSPQRQPLCM